MRQPGSIARTGSGGAASLEVTSPRRPCGLLRLAVGLALALGLSGCFGRPLGGDGSTVLRIRLTRLEAPSATMKGSARVELTDFETLCPVGFGPVLANLGHGVAPLHPDQEPARFEVVPDHLLRVEFRHQSGPRRDGETCQRELWLVPRAGITYEFLAASKLTGCLLQLVSPQGPEPIAFPSCEQLAEAGLLPPPDEADEPDE